MIESPSFFSAYKSVLECLREKEIIPFKEILLSGDSEKNLPPKYIQENPKINYSQITKEKDNSFIEDVTKEWVETEKTILNESENESMKSVFRKKVSLIQGGPGTGKTFMGRCIAKIMGENINVPKPIVVICYTNHALDSFLEPLLDDFPKLIRIGTRTKSTNKRYLNRQMKNLISGLKRRNYLFQTKEISDLKLVSLEIKKMKKLVSELSFFRFADNWDIYTLIRHDLSSFAFDQIFFEYVNRTGDKSGSSVREIFSKWINMEKITEISKRLLRKREKRRKAAEKKRLQLEKEEEFLRKRKEEERRKKIKEEEIKKRKAEEYRRKKRKEEERLKAEIEREKKLIAKKRKKIEKQKRKEEKKQKLLDIKKNKEEKKAFTQKRLEENQKFIEMWQSGKISLNEEFKANSEKRFKDFTPTVIEEETTNESEEKDEKNNDEDEDDDDDDEGYNLIEEEEEEKKEEKLEESSESDDDDDDDDEKEHNDGEKNSQNSNNSEKNEENEEKEEEEENEEKEEEQEEDSEKIEEVELYQPKRNEEEEEDAFDQEEANKIEKKIDTEAVFLGEKDIDFDISDELENHRLEILLDREEHLEEFLNFDDAFEGIENSQVDTASLGSSQLIKEFFKKVKNILGDEPWKLKNRQEIIKDIIKRFKSFLKKLEISMFEEYQALNQKKMDLKLKIELKLLKESKLIGLTSTMASIRRRLLHNLKAKVYIFEEAAELMEGQILASFPNDDSVEHVILIGDHKQLKPKYNCFDLQKLGIDRSLFERLDEIGINPYKLTVQQRMRPEIAFFMRHFFYPEMTNHNVDYDPVEGHVFNLQFIKCNFEESTGYHSRSKTNIEEAKFIVNHVFYLFKNRDFGPKDITILTPYKGQMFVIMRMLREMFNKNRSLLREIGIRYDQFKNLRVETIDNFQGEENEIVLVSLVRSKTKGRNRKENIGFLKIQNRIIVTLSRAKQGCYIYGNGNLMKQRSGDWDKLLTEMEIQGRVHDCLLLKCKNHPNQIYQIKKSTDFSKIKCDLVCGHKLECGHLCKKKCHFDSHVCTSPCGKLLSCGHDECKMKCGHLRKCMCKKIIDHTFGCGHVKKMMCYKTEKAKCKVIISETLKCGHIQKRRCCDEIRECEEIIDHVLPCGHTTKKKCGDTSVHYCTHKSKELLSCGHYREILCENGDPFILLHQRMNIYKCNETVEVIHPICGHKMLVKCYQKLEVSDLKCHKRVNVQLPCGHSKNLRCFEKDIKEKKICKKNCDKILSCGHKCTGVCGDCLENGHKKCRIEVIESCPRCEEKIKKKCYEMIICRNKCNERMDCNHRCVNNCLKCDGNHKCIFNCKREKLCGHYCKGNHICGTVCSSCQDICNFKCSHGVRCSEFCNDNCKFEKCTHDFYCLKHGTYRCYECKNRGLQFKKYCNRVIDRRYEHRICCMTRWFCRFHGFFTKNCSRKCRKIQVSCNNACKHRQCRKKCYQLCSVGPCNERCDKNLRCGHRCFGLCGEVCPPCLICDGLFGKVCYLSRKVFEFRELQSQPIYQLPCGCVFWTKALDDYMFSPSTDGSIIKHCPQCKKPIQDISRCMRYERVIKASIWGLNKVKTTKRCIGEGSNFFISNEARKNASNFFRSFIRDSVKSIFLKKDEPVQLIVKILEAVLSMKKQFYYETGLNTEDKELTSFLLKQSEIKKSKKVVSIALVQYIHAFIQKEKFDESKIKRGLVLLNFVEDKDIFISSYKSMMQKRLLHGLSLEQNEKWTLNEISRLCNYFSSKDLYREFGKLLVDINLSGHLNSEFKSNTKDIRNFDFNVKVLCSANWTIENSPLPQTIPKTVLNLQKEFSNFYEKKHPNRNLKWVLNGSNMVQMKCNLKYFDGILLLNGIQSIILLSFQEKDHHTKKDLSKLIEKTENQMMVYLYRMCSRDKHSKKIVFLNGDNIFLNVDYKVKSPRIILISPSFSKSEIKTINKKTINQRKLTVQAKICRIMKKKKEMDIKKLEIQVCMEIKLFVCSSNMSKEMIDFLVVKGYLEVKGDIVFYVA